MSYSEEGIRTEEDGRNTNTEKKKRKGWVTALIVILGILALPVLIPLVLIVGGGVILAVVCIVGAVIMTLLGIAGTAAMIVLCLIGAILLSLIGIGFGIVILFSAPASGMAILGVSLMMAGFSAIGAWLAWLIGKWCVIGIGKLFRWIGKHLHRKQKAEVESHEA